MSKIEYFFSSFRDFNQVALGDTIFHKIDPRAKLLVTIIFIGMVLSYHKYEVISLIPFFSYPLIFILGGKIPFKLVFKRALLVSPFVLLIAIFNPFLDRAALYTLNGLEISGGLVSFFSIILRFFLTISSIIILLASTKFETFCFSLQKLKAPSIFVVQLLLMWRYIFVLLEETARMVRAYFLRNFNLKKGIKFRIYIYILGNLLLRSLARAQRIYLAMLSRGFQGKIMIIDDQKFGVREIFYVSGWTLFFVGLRFLNLPYKMGLLFWS